MSMYINPSGDEDRIFCTVAADAMDPIITRSSVAMVLSMWDKWVLVFYEKEFQLSVSLFCWEMAQSVHIF